MLSYSKYRAKKTEVGGIVFDSLKEAKRYKELVLLERSGEIKRLILQPRFLIQDKFKYNNKTERAIHYVADFMYTDKTGAKFVEDIKGVKTAEYKLKRKLFIKKYCFDEKGNEIIKFIET